MSHPGAPGAHVCHFVDPDGNTTGHCHLPGPHGGRCPECVVDLGGDRTTHATADDCEHQSYHETVQLCDVVGCRAHGPDDATRFRARLDRVALDRLTRGVRLDELGGSTRVVVSRAGTAPVTVSLEGDRVWLTVTDVGPDDDLREDVIDAGLDEAAELAAALLVLLRDRDRRRLAEAYGAHRDGSLRERVVDELAEELP